LVRPLPPFGVLPLGKRESLRLGNPLVEDKPVEEEDYWQEQCIFNGVENHDFRVAVSGLAPSGALVISRGR
jgi:hypothetical protein